MVAKKQIESIKELMANIVEEFKDRYDFYQHRAYLKKMGWTEEQYQEYNDPRRNQRATHVKQYYHGYPYFYAYQTSRVDPFTRYPTWMDAYQAIKDWCKDNCQGAWRHDILRVEEGQYELEINEMGKDSLFFAFENDRDFTMFLLKWT